jgi:hypothetical protein
VSIIIKGIKSEYIATVVYVISCKSMMWRREWEKRDCLPIQLASTRQQLQCTCSKAIGWKCPLYKRVFWVPVILKILELIEIRIFFIRNAPTCALEPVKNFRTFRTNGQVAQAKESSGTKQKTTPLKKKYTLKKMYPLNFFYPPKKNKAENPIRTPSDLDKYCTPPWTTGSFIRDTGRA